MLVIFEQHLARPYRSGRPGGFGAVPGHPDDIPPIPWGQINADVPKATPALQNFYFQWEQDQLHGGLIADAKVLADAVSIDNWCQQYGLGA